jgi:hypothetical protein
VNKLKTASYAQYIFRISRGDPWTIRPPRGFNRFDIFDPEESVMTLYTGESKEAAWAEVLAPFRPDLETIASINDIPCDDNRTPSSGRIPRAWLQERQIGKAKVRKEAVIVDISHPETIQVLRSEPTLAKKAIQCGFIDLDDSALKASNSQARHLTQMIAAYVYNRGNAGIRYESRLGSKYKCIAGFVALSTGDTASSKFIEEILPSENASSGDYELQTVATMMNLILPYIVR